MHSGPGRTVPSGGSRAMVLTNGLIDTSEPGCCCCHVTAFSVQFWRGTTVFPASCSVVHLQGMLKGVLGLWRSSNMLAEASSLTREHIRDAEDRCRKLLSLWMLLERIMIVCDTPRLPNHWTPMGSYFSLGEERGVFVGPRDGAAKTKRNGVSDRFRLLQQWLYTEHHRHVSEECLGAHHTWCRDGCRGVPADVYHRGIGRVRSRPIGVRYIANRTARAAWFPRVLHR